MDDSTAVRVLIVDDHPDLRALVRSVLGARDDFDVVGEGSDGAQGVEEAARLQPDLVVLDLFMPVMNGLTALPLIRRVAPDARVVILTANPQVAGDALERGAVAVLEKQSIVELPDLLNRALDRVGSTRC